jgi:DNA-binding MarR family transcriptional regulator
MASDKNTLAHPDSETQITLGLLNAVHENSSVTQRSVAKELGIALGLANNYLKRCVSKGLIKVKQAPANRYAYYLTPMGFAEKSQLTARYLTMSFDFFRHARTHCTDVFVACERAGLHRLCLAGASDLAEIAMICAHSSDVDIKGILDEKAAGQDLAGLTVLKSIEDMGPIDALVLTDLAAPQATYDRLLELYPEMRIVAPKLLNISQNGAGGMLP